MSQEKLKEMQEKVKEAKNELTGFVKLELIRVLSQIQKKTGVLLFLYCSVSSYNDGDISRNLSLEWSIAPRVRGGKSPRTWELEIDEESEDYKLLNAVKPELKYLSELCSESESLAWELGASYDDLYIFVVEKNQFVKLWGY